MPFCPPQINIFNRKTNTNVESILKLETGHFFLITTDLFYLSPQQLNPALWFPLHEIKNVKYTEDLLCLMYAGRKRALPFV